jgi:hypothetical protein
MRLVLGFRISS